MELKTLLKAGRKMSDWEIKHDFDACVVTLADSEEDAEELKRYGTRRRKAKHFSPGKPGHNNHEYVTEPKSKKKQRQALQPDGDECPRSYQPSGMEACRAVCDKCSRSTYVRKDGTWARHTPPKR